MCVSLHQIFTDLLNFKGQESSRDSPASDLLPSAGIPFTFNLDKELSTSVLSPPVVSVHSLVGQFLGERCWELHLFIPLMPSENTENSGPACPVPGP